MNFREYVKTTKSQSNSGASFLSKLCGIIQPVTRTAGSIPQQTYYSYSIYMKKLLTDEKSRSIVSDIEKHIIPIDKIGI